MLATHYAFSFALFQAEVTALVTALATDRDGVTFAFPLPQLMARHAEDRAAMIATQSACVLAHPFL